MDVENQPQDQSQQNQPQDQSQDQSQQNQPSPAPKQKNTGMAIVAYILFFIPLFTEAKKDPFVKYHVRQGLLIFLGWIVVMIVDAILPWQFYFIGRLLDLFVLILMIIGIMSAAKGEQKPLPIIGKLAEQFKF